MYMHGKILFANSNILEFYPSEGRNHMKRNKFPFRRLFQWFTFLKGIFRGNILVSFKNKILSGKSKI